jgi:hypothetical protein
LRWQEEGVSDLQMARIAFEVPAQPRIERIKPRTERDPANGSAPEDRAVGHHL